MPECAVCGEENPDKARFCNDCGEPLEEHPSEHFRRVVTILFSDVVDSTGLGERIDPETLHHVLTDYFEGIKPVVERHGGTVAKFIGDAVMAVFGLTELHEDDALRAVRAALELQETLTRLNEDFEQRYGVVLATRTGINTGTVAGAGVARERNFVSGDTANTAARLQQSAQPGEIVLGESTFRLVRDSVEAVRVELELKGKQRAAAAYRLVSVVEPSGVVARSEATLVGRQDALAQLAWALERVEAERSCRLLDHLGERPERDPLAVGEAAPLKHCRLLREAGHELVDEPRLADSGHADDRDEAAASLGLDPLERPRELGEGVLAADERGL
jgi:class 3 adenylate cyclase